MNRTFDQELFLVWKDPETRQRCVVGQLWQEDGRYHFRYIDSLSNALTKAQSLGFRLLPSFPDRNKVYSSNQLFGTFRRRLPDSSRPDWKKLTKSLGLSEDASSFEILEATGGRLPTDMLEFVPPIEEEKEGRYRLEFYIAGWRYYDGRELERSLKVGEEFEPVVEKDNPYDPHAIQIKSLDGHLLGYVPVMYSRYLDEIILQGHYRLKVVQFNPQADAQHAVKVSFYGRVPDLMPKEVFDSFVAD